MTLLLSYATVSYADGRSQGNVNLANRIGKGGTLMRKCCLLAISLTTTAVLAWSCGTGAYAADAKAEITALEHQCATATSADELMAKCYDSSSEVAVYDLSPPREFVGPKAVHDDFD